MGILRVSETNNLLQGYTLEVLGREMGEEVGSNTFGLMINLVANLCPANLASGYLHFYPVYTANGHFQEGHVTQTLKNLWPAASGYQDWPKRSGQRLKDKDRPLL